MAIPLSSMSKVKWEELWNVITAEELEYMKLNGQATG